MTPGSEKEKTEPKKPDLQKVLQAGDESGPPRPRPCWRSRSMPRAGSRLASTSETRSKSRWAEAAVSDCWVLGLLAGAERRRLPAMRGDEAVALAMTASFRGADDCWTHSAARACRPG